LKVSTQSGQEGHYALTVATPTGDSTLYVSVVARRIGYQPLSKQLELKAGDSVTVDFTFCPSTGIYEFALRAGARQRGHAERSQIGLAVEFDSRPQ
jgi:hypothetical protein